MKYFQRAHEESLQSVMRNINNRLKNIFNYGSFHEPRECKLHHDLPTSHTANFIKWTHKIRLRIIRKRNKLLKLIDDTRFLHTQLQNGVAYKIKVGHPLSLEAWKYLVAGNDLLSSNDKTLDFFTKKYGNMIWKATK